MRHREIDAATRASRVVWAAPLYPSEPWSHQSRRSNGYRPVALSAELVGALPLLVSPHDALSSGAAPPNGHAPVAIPSMMQLASSPIVSSSAGASWPEIRQMSGDPG